jgi:hypothetical protein
MTRWRPSRRVLMYGLVGAQLLVLAAIVAPQELNRALDTGPAVDLEIPQARAGKDPFRGAYVYGHSSLDLDGPTVPIPAGLRGGERVLVTFAVQPGRLPRIVAVDRARRRPPFTATGFTVSGRVVDERTRTRIRHDRLMRAHVGKPAVAIDLELPASIAVDESALAHLSGPGMVHASLHAGFFGQPYFTDVRLSGRAWPPDMRFAYDDTRQRLIVFAPREMTHAGFKRSRTTSEDDVESDLFVFDATGKELSTTPVQGRIVDGVIEADGRLLALVSQRRWSPEVSLVRYDEAGQVLQRSVPIALDRVLGFDVATASVWSVAAPTATPPQPPHFIQRVGVGGVREPRLGPFDSVPRAVVAAGDDVWVLETQRHRVTRLDAASGRVVREYRDLNDPGDIAVDGRTLYVIEANRTQLTSFADDGRLLWRVPRFQGLTWALPDGTTGGGWVGAAMFEGTKAGVLRFARDGAIARLPATARPAPRGDWERRFAGEVVRSARDGRLFFREHDAIAILGADGASLIRVIGFRLEGGPRLRS